MEAIIKQNRDDTYCCLLCPNKPSLEKKSVHRHILESSKHQTSIAKKVDIEGHEVLIPKIIEKRERETSKSIVQHEKAIKIRMRTT